MAGHEEHVRLGATDYPNTPAWFFWLLGPMHPYSCPGNFFKAQSQKIVCIRRGVRLDFEGTDGSRLVLNMVSGHRAVTYPHMFQTAGKGSRSP